MKFSFKIVVATLGITLLAAGCNPFVTKSPAGALKTTNGGADWIPANVIAGNPKLTLSDYTISTLQFDLTKKDVVYAGSYSGGLLKSEDSAGSWKSILSRIAVYDMAISPTDAQTIYAGGYAVDHGKLLKTVDGGKSWEEMYSEETTSNAVRAVVINPDNANEIAIGLSSGNLVKSFDAGRNWVLVRNFQDRINRMVWQNGSLYVVLQTKGLFKSSDGGVNFEELTNGIVQKAGGNSIFSSGVQGVQNFSQFAVNKADPTEIYVTTDLGAYKTSNTGKTWVRLNVPIQNKNSQFRAVSISASNPRIVYMSAGSTIYKTLDGGISFQTQGIVTSGFINYILINPELPQIAYAGIYSQ